MASPGPDDRSADTRDSVTVSDTKAMALRAGRSSPSGTAVAARSTRSGSPTAPARPIARVHGVTPAQVFVGNGSDEVLAHAFVALLKQPKPLLFPDVTYSFYPVWAQLFSLAFETVPLDGEMRVRVDTSGHLPGDPLTGLGGLQQPLELGLHVVHGEGGHRDAVGQDGHEQIAQGHHAVVGGAPPAVPDREAEHPGHRLRVRLADRSLRQLNPLLGVVAPDAFAQAPTPTFKINGLIDQVMSYSRNTSNYDGNLHNNDKLWYGRTRGRRD